MSNKALGWVFENSPYKGAKLVIHLAIADVVNDAYGDEFWMSNGNLAIKANATRQTVNSTLQEMVEDGYLERLGTGEYDTVKYRFLYFEGCRETLHPLSDLATPPVKNGDTPLSGNLTPPVGKFDTIPSRTQTVNPSGNQKETNVVSDAQRVWDAYEETLLKCGFQKKRATKDRMAKIKDKLKEWSVEELIQAVRGLEFSSFHRGDNDNGKVYNDILLILRDTKHIDQFIGYSETAPSLEPKTDAWGRSFDDF